MSQSIFLDKINKTHQKKLCQYSSALTRNRSDNNTIISVQRTLSQMFVYSLNKVTECNFYLVFFNVFYIFFATSEVTYGVNNTEWLSSPKTLFGSVYYATGKERSSYFSTDKFNTSRIQTGLFRS